MFTVLRGGGAAAMLLTELEHGSNLARTGTRADPDGDGYRLTGEKHLTNGGSRHDLLVTLARLGDSDRFGLRGGCGLGRGGAGIGLRGLRVFGGAAGLTFGALY